MQIEKSIFKEYDLRGIADKELTPESVDCIGRAIGTYFRSKNEKQVILCHDNRLSSDWMVVTMQSALRSTGCDVTDIGMHPTPLCYYASHKLRISASVMITASHNPAEYNGMKICSEGQSIFGESIRNIQKLAEDESFISGVGTLSFYDSIEDDYIVDIVERIQLKRPLSIAVDTGNGSAGPVAVRLYKALGCKVIPINIEPDGHYPDHHPDPTIPENMTRLKQAVLEQRLACGLGMDGDGDRLGVVGNDGEIIWGDMLQILYWREIMRHRSGLKALVEVKCSQNLFNEIERLGGIPFFYKTGHSLIKAKMRQDCLLFAGEMSGHMFFADEYYGYDDALYAGARLLRILSEADETISQLLSDVPRTCVTPEIRIDCPEEEKEGVISYATEYFYKKGFPIETIDGIRVSFPNGWGLLRKSNTQPIIVMRAEAKTRETLESIVAELQSALSLSKNQINETKS